MKQLEYEAQCRIFEWAKYYESVYPEVALLNSSMNGVRLSPGLRVKTKKAGMKKGYPDILLPVKRGKYSGLYIELKIGKNKATQEQEWFLKQLANQSFYCAIVYGSDKSIELIKNYLKGDLK